jgi:hypothetical protein
MPDRVEGDDELRRGIERLERYFEDPDLAALVERATPLAPREPATSAHLADLRALVDTLFGPDELPTQPALEEIWTRGPSVPRDFARYLGAIVRAVRGGESVRRAAIGWRIRHLHSSLKIRASAAGPWGRQFTRGPAWPP